MFCELGEMVTDQFETFADACVQCKWYLLPIKMQLQYGTFMCGVQQPTYIRGFGNIECARETLKKVCMLYVGSVQINMMTILFCF